MAFLLLAPPAVGQAPSTDIFLVPLGDGGRAVAGPPRNLTARDGYDNQPFWTADGRALWFSSVREGVQSDIYRVEVATGAVTRITTTAPESEYSPTLMPGGDALSVVRVERDSTQRLWRIPLGGGPESLLLEQVEPVGYHAWVDSVTLVLFVLGSPNSLQLANVTTGRADTVTTGVGRSLHRVPNAARASFVKVESREESWIMTLDPRTGVTERVVRLPAGVQDYAWLPDGSILIGEGGTLKRWQRGGDWMSIGEVSGVGEITRLAVSPRGDAVAVVGVPVTTGGAGQRRAARP